MPDWLLLVISILIGTVILAIVLAVCMEFPQTIQFVRGRRLISWSSAMKRSASAEHSSTRPPLHFGRVPLPAHLEPLNFLIVGSPAGGKTITLTALLLEVLQAAATFLCHIVVYDPKNDMGPFIEFLKRTGQIPPELEILHMNPYYRSGVPWDLKTDIKTSEERLVLAHALVREAKSGHDRYWIDGARDLLSACIQALTAIAPETWTFKDLFTIATHKKRLHELLSAVPETQGRAQLYFAKGSRVGAVNIEGILSTLRTELYELEPVAALWATSKERPLSLREWVKDRRQRSTVLILGFMHNSLPVFERLNSAIVSVLGRHLLSLPDSTERRVWLFFDELKQLGYLPTLSSELLTVGRSRGLACVLAFQDLPGLIATYGEAKAQEILALCANQAFLRTNDRTTAEYAASRIGQAEVIEMSWSETDHALLGWQQSQRSYHRTSRQAVLPEQLMELPYPSPEGGLHGYFLSEPGAWRAAVPVSEWPPKIPESEVRAFVHAELRAPEERAPLFYSEADRVRLGPKAPTTVDGGEGKNVTKPKKQPQGGLFRDLRQAAKKTHKPEKGEHS